MRRSRTMTMTAAAALVALTATACGSSGSSSSSTTSSSSAATTAAAARPVIDPGDGGRYAPKLDPANFVDGVDHPYFPLPVGATWTYDGQEDGSREQIDVVVLPERREVMGISAVVVRDTVKVDGQLAEDTYDWYAQDTDGNVWYLGEETKEYENGKVTSTAGSWEAGVDGAYPGIVMQGDPKAGDAYRQEYFQGEAEDLAKVVSTGVTETVPTGEYHDLVRIREWNPLAPKVVEDKYYTRGIGPVLETVQRGGTGRIELTKSSLVG